MIVFLGDKKPFEGRDKNVVLVANKNVATDKLRAKAQRGDVSKYVAAVKTPDGSNVGVFEDPHLEVGDGLGGGGTKKTPAKKKVVKKAKRK